MSSPDALDRARKIGIAAHSYEGGILCFKTACEVGQQMLGPHMHPDLLLSAIPMGLSMPGWESGDHDVVALHLAAGVEQVAQGGAEFFICPDNTAHIVLETIVDTLPIPGLHIAEVVCNEISLKGWTRIGLLGTKCTMSGPVYAAALEKRGMVKLIPNDRTRAKINDAIFYELCQGTFRHETTGMFIDAIDELRSNGAECVILGCTEIPLIINEANSPLPVLDSTRLLARYAVELALSGRSLPDRGWIAPAPSAT